MSNFKKVGRIVVSIILWIVILLAALFAFVTIATKDPNNLASIGGITPLSVKTDSMSPTFNAGDLILIKKVDPATLQVGDIVTFHTIIEDKYALNTHRIAEIIDHGSYREYMTKGDNNAIADTALIIDGDIAGKYFAKLPVLGKIVDFLSSKVGFFVVILLPLLAFFIYQVYHLIMVAIEYKKADAIEQAIAIEEAKHAAAKQMEDLPDEPEPLDESKQGDEPVPLVEDSSFVQLEENVEGKPIEKPELTVEDVQNQPLEPEETTQSHTQATEDDLIQMRAEAARMMLEAKRAQEQLEAKMKELQAMTEKKDDDRS